MTYFTYKFNIMAADVLAKEEAKASTAMVLTKLTHWPLENLNEILDM